MKRIHRITLFFITVLWLIPIQTTGKDRIPMEMLLQRPAISNAELSPQGDYVAFLIPDKKRDIVGMMTMNLKTGKTNIIKPHGTMDIYNFNWLNNDEIVFEVGTLNIYTQGTHIVHKDKKRARPLWFLDSTSIVDLLPLEKNRLLLWVQETIRKQKGLFLIDTGKPMGDAGKPENILRRYEDPPGFVLNWAADADGLPRLATVHFGDKDKTRYLFRPNMKESWKELPIDPLETGFFDFDPDGDHIFVSAFREKETTGLYRYNLSTEEFGESLFRDQLYDFSSSASLVFSSKEGRLVGIYYDRQKPVTWWISESFINAQAVLDSALPDGINRIIDFSDDDSIFLAVNFSDQNPGTYFILDLENHSLSKLLDKQPWIDPTEMAETKPVRYSTRDGLSLLAYLTLPSTGEKPYPTIVLPHGGPWARDLFGYDPEVQFLASLGFAVLQPNYRGSTGFKHEISKRDMFDFLKMHDDVTDATLHLIEQSLAEPGRIVIMGASFGGYLALCGVAFEPDLYCAGITNVGVFDWVDLIRSERDKAGDFAYDYLTKNLGHYKEDVDYLKKISPFFSVPKIKVPVLVAHGKEDKRAPFQQSRRLAKAFEKNGIVHEKIFIAWEGHGYFSIKNKREYYSKVEQFLSKHVPSGREAKERIAVGKN